MIFVEAHHPNGIGWNLTHAATPDEVERAKRWYRAQLDGLDGARVEVVELDGTREQFLARETFTPEGWREVPVPATEARP